MNTTAILKSHVDQRKFLDSGLAALDAHKEELYEAVKEYLDADLQGQGNWERKVRSILNQIEKEKWV